MNNKRTFLLITCLFFSYKFYSQCTCPDIEVSTEVISVVNVSELSAALDRANANNGNLTIMVQPGEYNLTSNLLFIRENMENLSIIGASGNHEDVFIRGMGWNNSAVTHIFSVAADNFTVANMTIGEVFYHPIQVHSNPSDADNFLAQNVRFVDAKEQLLKVSGGGNLLADNGRIICCEFEFTEGIAYQYYTGGIDAHRSKDWEVKYNMFRGIRSPENLLAEHAIHFWKESEGTVVDANLIIDCDRGIGFGLGESATNGHKGGLIMNNMVHTSRDVGIGLETASDVKIYNNTVVTENYSNSIEYRFESTTGAQIANNLVNARISDRSSGSTGILSTNHILSDLSIFEDAVDYNYHLDDEQDLEFLNAGTHLEEVTTDFDCAERPLSDLIDIGADQVASLSATFVKTKDVVLNIFPNPSFGTFTIQGALKNSYVEVFNSLGIRVQDLWPRSNRVSVNLENYIPGAYTIKVQNDDRVVTKTIKLTK